LRSRSCSRLLHYAQSRKFAEPFFVFTIMSSAALLLL